MGPSPCNRILENYPWLFWGEDDRCHYDLSIFFFFGKVLVIKKSSLGLCEIDVENDFSRQVQCVLRSLKTHT